MIQDKDVNQDKPVKQVVSVNPEMPAICSLRPTKLTYSFIYCEHHFKLVFIAHTFLYSAQYLKKSHLNIQVLQRDRVYTNPPPL